MERLTFSNLELKAEAEEGNSISGYAAVFGNRDRVGDILMKGAFLASIETGRKVKLLWNHNPDQIIGHWTELKEDDTGLFATGVFADTDRAREVKSLIKSGSVDSLSIGYKTVDFEYDHDGNRLLKQVDLYEVSCVTFAANESALISSVKAADMTIRELETHLRNSGLSRSVAQRLLAGGYENLNEKSDNSELIELLQKRNDILKNSKV